MEVNYDAMSPITDLGVLCEHAVVLKASFWNCNGCILVRNVNEYISMTFGLLDIS